jgi:hypothetical protein
VIVAGLIGVLGTCVGSFVTVWASNQNEERAAKQARDTSYRNEYREAVARFGTALLAYRLTELDLWFSRRGGRMEVAEARDHAYQARVDSWDALFQLELSTRDDVVLEAARRVRDNADSIHEADDRQNMQQRADGVREELRSVITTARASLLSP